MKPSTEIAPLTGLRFLAGFFIFINHVHRYIDMPSWAAKPIYAQGVSIFFVLSGFVLALNYHDRCDWRRYALGRFARIYPAFLLAAIFAYAFTPRPLPGCELALLQPWVACDPVNPVDWSIAVEAFFYAVFPFVIALRREASAFVIAVLIAATTMFVARGEWASWLTHLPILRLPEFLAGILIYKITRRNSFELGFATASLAEVASILILFAASWCSRLFYVYAASNPVLAEYVAPAGAFPAACCLIYILSQNKGVVSKLLSSKPINILGHASYAFYLFHLTIIENMRHQPWLAFILSIALSLVVYFAFETPCKGVLNRLPRRIADRGKSLSAQS